MKKVCRKCPSPKFFATQDGHYWLNTSICHSHGTKNNACMLINSQQIHHNRWWCCRCCRWWWGRADWVSCQHHSRWGHELVWSSQHLNNSHFTCTTTHHHCSLWSKSPINVTTVLTVDLVKWQAIQWTVIWMSKQSTSSLEAIWFS